ncbi:MAG: hypothetical protein CMQ43_10805 [Gammaproteobacteria bacterium]|jgi:hypothetical protein|nr:hypothetical protein [Gammaproteobacteria bacterium]
MTHLPTHAILCITAAALSAMLPAAAGARTEAVREFDGLTAYCSTVNTAELSPESLSRYGVEPGADRGLLTCQVRPARAGAGPATLAADVEAQVHGLGEPPRAVAMRETESDGYISYIGTYAANSRYPLEFTVTIDVADAGSVALEMTDHDPRP